MQAEEKICFVVMGFGRKTDFETGRMLDLDATYEAIIQPSLEECGIRCIRANEVLHSGVIDVRMYEMLLRADLVIADISTGNVNAVYELGVRHALRPNSTIIMKEKEGKLHFDLNHTNTFIYEHLGEDIGSREAGRAKRDLISLISESLESTQADSPVYTYLPSLRRPVLSDEDYQKLVDDAERIEEKFSDILAAAEEYAKASDHINAVSYFHRALDMTPNNHYLIQQLALHTYKSKHPSEWVALIRASQIIEGLDPSNSNDPETLGIAGAIYKNMWRVNDDGETLNQAIRHYERGFDLRGDYYNGENAAACLISRSQIQEVATESTYDKMTARKIYESIYESLIEVTQSDEFSDRLDKVWVFATLANCHYVFGRTEEAKAAEKMFKAEYPSDWQISTYEDGIAMAMETAELFRELR